MKILIVRPTPNKMNGNTYNLQEIGLAKALVRKGHTCDVMYYTDEKKDSVQTVQFDDDKEVHILWLHGFSILREGIYPSLKKYAGDYDIIQVGGHENLTSLWLNRKYGNKTVNFQGPYFCESNKGDIKKALVFDKTVLPLSHKKNMIVATKSKLATEYIQKKGIDNVTTIGVGLDLSNIETKKEPTANNDFVQKLRDSKGDCRYLLYIGVLEDRRNLFFMVNVFKNVLSIDTQMRLVIVGKGKKEYKDSLFSYISELGLEDKIIYQERLEQTYISELYKICDAFLLPTKYEIFGMVLLEAMYYGLPVFTTYNGGSSTLMNEQNGVIIDNWNEGEWAKTIVKILNNSELNRSISENAHATIAEKYTWDALADLFLAVYKSRLDEKE